MTRTWSRKSLCALTGLIFAICVLFLGEARAIEAHDTSMTWFSADGSDDGANEVMAAIESASVNGLDASTYDLSVVRSRIAQDHGGSPDIDSAIAEKVRRFLWDMAGCRDDIVDLRTGRKNALECGHDIPLLSKVQILERLKNTAPQTPFYRALQAEYSVLGKVKNKNDPPITVHILRPGDRDKDILAIRGRLALDTTVNNADYYDENLAVAVMEFQRRNRIEPDAVINKETRAAFNRPVQDRMAQVAANMARLRRLKDLTPDRYIVVNVPSASLSTVENGTTVFDMPVIAGRAARPTPSFITEITGVKINPDWTVPPTIKRDDFLARLRADPDILSKNGIHLYRGGKPVDASTIDWAHMSSRELSQLAMIQPGGKNNPLGTVRVIMNNPYGIYLHGAADGETFDRDSWRSSGCLRMKYPERVAAFITGNGKSLDETIATGKSKEILAAEPVPVFILYMTMWLDDSGRLIYGNDYYRKDGAISVLRHMKAEQRTSKIKGKLIAAF